MYRALFDLKRLPFDKELDVECFMLTDSGKEVLDAIMSEVGRGTEIIVVSGGPGVGKSLLAAHAAERAQDVWRSELLDGTEGMSGWEEVIQIANESCAADQHSIEEAPLMLLVDNAEQLSDEELLGLVDRVEEGQVGTEKVRIVFFSRPSLSMRLHRDSMKRIRSHINQHLQLKGLSITETAEYINLRLQTAGRRGASPFSEDAIESVHRLTQGVPRLINQRCTTALNRAFRKQSRIVEASMITGALLKPGTFGASGSKAVDEGSSDCAPNVSGKSQMATTEVEATIAGGESPQLIGKRDASKESVDVDEDRLLEIQELLLASFKAGEALADRLESCTKRAESVVSSEQEVVARLAGEQSAMSHASDQIQQMLQSAGEFMSSLEQRESSIQERLDRFEQRFQGGSDVIGADAGKGIDEAVLRADGVIDQLRIRFEKVAQWERDVDTRLSELAEAISKKSASAVSEMESSCASAAREAKLEIDRSAESARKSVLGELDSTRRSESQLRARIEKEREELDRLLKELDEREASLKRRMEDAEASTGTIAEMHADVTGRHEQVTKLLSRMDDRFDEVGGQFEELEIRSESIATIVAELNRREQEVVGLLKDMDDREAGWKIKSSELESARSSMESIGREFDERMESLAERMLATEVAKADLSTVEERVSDTISSTDHVFDRMKEWDDRLRKSFEGAVEQGRVIEELLAMAEVKNGQWASQVHSSTSAASLLAESCKEAHHLINELKNQEHDSRRSADRVESATQQAGEVEERLESAGNRGRDLLGELNQGSEKLGELCGQLGQTLEEALSIHGSSQQILRRLSERTQKAEETGEHLIDQVDALEVGIVKAQSVVAALDEKRRDEEQALTRYDEMSSLLSTHAKEASQIVTRLERMHGEILGAIKNAECASESMRTLSESSAKMLEQFGRRQDALAPTNELLAQMFKRVRDMAGQVDEIDEKAAASRTRMEKMLELPDQIVREAKAQSAQLNDVCRSVRKVFGSLSRVSLEANERVEQFNKSRQESDDRSMKLQEELREAGETMREWVREAERVQSRLENSIERAPKLDRTHPSQSFARLLDLAVGRPGDVEEPVVEEPSPGTSGNMEPTVLTNVADGRVPKRTADEIAAMIREAENRSAATTF